MAELTENGDGSISPFAAAQSRRPVGNLQRLYGNQPVLQMRKGSDVPPAASVPLRPGESGILQRTCACGGAAGMSVECEECSKKRRLGLQAKLKVNEPGDIYEQEADRIADRVIATPAHPAINGAPPRIQRFSGQPNGLDTAPASVDRTLASPGRPVEPALRQDMEQRFGHDFSRVRVHADTQAAVAQRRAAPAHVSDRAPATRLRPSQVPVRMTPTGDRTEAQARRFASTGRWATPVTPGGTYSISGYGVRALERGVAGPGSPLDPQTRRRFEPELGLDLANVRVHTDATAAASGRALGAKAYTVGSHIVFSPGRYQPATEGGRELLAHELAHVAQQAASGAPVVAALPDIDFWDVAGALTVGPGTYAVAKALDVSALDVLEAGARFVLGDTLFALLQSFLRGFKNGLEHAPSRQVDAISDRFDNFGVRDAYEVAEGFTIGVIKGLGQALWNLGKALITLLELPLKIQKFLMDLPQHARRYAPRIAQLVTEGSRLLKRLGEAFARDPAGTMAQLDRVLESARTFVLANVWNRGREAAKDVLGFLEKSWDDIGEFFGSITGQILFEVLLAVGTDLIGNIVKEAALLVGRVATRAVEAVKAIGGLIGRVLKWLEGLVGRFVGNTGEVLVAIRDWLRTLLKVFDEMAPEIEGAVVGPKGTGVTVPVPKPTVIESRIVRQPGSPTLADITPPKVHPSNLPKKTEPPKPTVPTEPPKPAVPKEPPKPAVPKEPPKPAVPAEPTKPAVPTQKERAAAKGKQEEAVAAKQKQESERKWRELQEAEQRRKATEPDRKRRQEEAAAKRKQEEPAPKEKPKAKAEAKDPEATAKKSARDKAREETERKIKEIEQEKKKLDVQDSSLRKAIRELNEKIERLNDELLKATEGDKPRILKEIEEAENTLNVNKGGGLRAELEGTSIKQWELTRAKKNLLEALKLERPSLRESTKRAIEEAATKRGNVPGGRETKPPYRFLDRKGKPIEHDQIHYGHSYGQEHRRLALQAQEKGMNQAQFNDWVNSHPEFFQIESEAENLSHAYEKPGID